MNSLPSYVIDSERASDNNSTKWTRTTPPQLHFTGMHPCMYVVSCAFVDTPNGVAKLGPHALATRGCAPPVQALLKVIGAESIAMWVLKMHKGVQIKLHDIAISVSSEQSLDAPLISMYACLLEVVQ